MKARALTIGKNSFYALDHELSITEIITGYPHTKLGRLVKAYDDFMEDEILLLEHKCSFLGGGKWQFIEDDELSPAHCWWQSMGL